ncbi:MULTISPECIES: SdpI family protein [unclassified Aeromicrobium]|uniref:SdpI family protein n=1 Tax=unclassified Aeromicrobium TaxID=2633570 RepID=UPI00396B130E
MSELLIARLVLFVVMAGAGVLLIWMARAAASGRLRRNALAGIRTPSTMASDEAWLAAHQRAERPTQAAGAASLLVAVVMLTPVSETAMFVAVMLGAAAMLVLVIHGAVVGGRAARALDD